LLPSGKKGVREISTSLDLASRTDEGGSARHRWKMQREGEKDVNDCNTKEGSVPN